MLWVCHMNKINNVPSTVLLSKLNERACKITQSRTWHIIDIQLILFPPFFALVLLKVLNQEHFLPTVAPGVETSGSQTCQHIRIPWGTLNTPNLQVHPTYIKSDCLGMELRHSCFSKLTL